MNVALVETLLGRIACTAFFIIILLTMTASAPSSAKSSSQAESTSRVELSPVAPSSPPVCRVAWTPAPYLEIDGNRIEPLMLFVNTGMNRAETMPTVRREVELAKNAGVRFISCCFSLPWGDSASDDAVRDYSNYDFWFDFILDIHPEAFIFPRIYLGPAEWFWRTEFAGEIIEHGDGKGTEFSMGSTVWRSKVFESLEGLVRHIEAHPRYARCVVGYHLTYGNTGEWFHFDYREHGNDISRPNKDAYWAWLIDKYGSPDEIARAWRMQTIEREKLTIYSDIAVKVRIPFMAPGTKDQQHIDFQEYCSDVVADSLIAASRRIKELTGGNRLVMAFYGYQIELTHGNSGHNALRRILSESSIDMLASPVSYLDRGAGGAAPFMALVDTMPLNKKLWMIEDDTRTHLASSKDFDADFNPKVATPAESRAVHMRNMATAIVHRTGLWWMDLWSNGWLADEGLWENIERIKGVYEECAARDASRCAEQDDADFHAGLHAGFHADIAFVVDDASFHYTPHGSTVNRLLLYDQRMPIYRSGVSYGLYCLADVASGKVRGPKVYVFLNAHLISDEARLGLERLKAIGNTLVWVFASDFIKTGSGTSTAPGAVTGFVLEQLPKGIRTVVEVPQTVAAPWQTLAGQALGTDVKGIAGYSVAQTDGIRTLGTYAKSTEVGFAALELGDWNSIFYGSWSLSPQLIRAISRYAGVPVYMDSDDILQTDGYFFSVYATSTGSKRIAFPQACSVKDALTGEVIATKADEVRFNLKKGECRWFIAESR